MSSDVKPSINSFSPTLSAIASPSRVLRDIWKYTIKYTCRVCNRIINACCHCLSMLYDTYAHIWCPQPECGRSADLHKDHVEYELVHYAPSSYTERIVPTTYTSMQLWITYDHREKTFSHLLVAAIYVESMKLHDDSPPRSSFTMALAIFWHFHCTHSLLISTHAVCVVYFCVVYYHIVQ